MIFFNFFFSQRGPAITATKETSCGSRSRTNLMKYKKHKKAIKEITEVSELKTKDKFFYFLLFTRKRLRN